jgi:hypothetical protein
MNLSIKSLDLIPSIPLTLELAGGGFGYADNVIAERLHIAPHECAHLVSAIACPRSGILGLQLMTRHHKNMGAGNCQTLECYPDEASLVSLCGYAWEELHGDVKRAAQDFKEGFRPHRAYMLHRAREFVVKHEQVINYAAVGVLALIPKNGDMGRAKLHALAQWLKPYITPYRSQYLTGELSQRENW